MTRGLPSSGAGNVNFCSAIREELLCPSAQCAAPQEYKPAEISSSQHAMRLHDLLQDTKDEKSMVGCVTQPLVARPLPSGSLHVPEASGCEVVWVPAKAKPRGQEPCALSDCQPTGTRWAHQRPLADTDEEDGRGWLKTGKDQRGQR